MFNNQYSFTELLRSAAVCSLVIALSGQYLLLAQKRNSPLLTEVGEIAKSKEKMKTGPLESSNLSFDYLNALDFFQPERDWSFAPQAATSTLVQEAEPNNTVATATPIGRSVKVRASSIFPNGDIDYYSFQATAGDRVYAGTMTSFSAGSSTDSVLTLYASDGTTVIEADNDNGSFAALSSSIAGATIPTTGTYYLRVNDFTAGTTSERPYELWLNVLSGTPTAEVEPNDTPAQANVLPASGWVSGARNPAAATEQDWYSIPLNAGDTVFLSLDLDPERDGVTWNGRLGMALFGDAGNQILVVDDAGAAETPTTIPSEGLYLTVKDAGTYYAFVDSASAAVGGPTSTYHLSVSVLPRSAFTAGLTCNTYTSTNVPQTIGPANGLVSSTLTVPGNPRIASMRVFVNLNHALMADVDAHLRSPAGNNNGIFTDIGAAATGGQTQMDAVFNDDAGVPPFSTVLRGLELKPELNYRLGWFNGEDAGGTWTLDLYDDTNNASGGTLNSWGLEICTAPALTGNVLYSQNFEANDGGYTHSGTQDEWEYGLPATAATTTANPLAAFTTCNSGVNCWKTDLDSTYNVSSNQNLDSPDINLTNATGSLNLSWAMKYQMESASFDHLYVEIQDVADPSRNRIVWQFLDATMTDAPGNPVTNIGASAGWGEYRANISDFVGRTIRVRFHVDTDTTVNFPGAAIDDVQIRGFAPTAAPVSITGRVMLPNDPRVTSATVTLTDAQGGTRTMRTGKFGNFRFDNVGAGATYVITVQARGYTFASQVVNAAEDVTGLVFIYEE